MDQQNRGGFGLWIVTSFPLIGSRIITGSAFVSGTLKGAQLKLRFQLCYLFQFIYREFAGAPEDLYKQPFSKSCPLILREPHGNAAFFPAVLSAVGSL
jgi:hypothetical protein